MKKATMNTKTLFALIFALVMCVNLMACGVADAETVSDTSYGTVDWSPAGQGYITFTASGQGRCFILQGPVDEQQAIFTAQEDETVQIPLDAGAGRYQYAVADIASDGKTCTVHYKDSFTVG